MRGAGIGGICEESRDFPGALASARTARHFAVETLQRWGAGRFAGDVALVVAELATNAVLHARSGFTLTLSWRGSGVRVAVRDAVPLPSHTPGPMVLPTRQLHGLGAVAALATKWGANRAADGKTVWAELSPQM